MTSVASAGILTPVGDAGYTNGYYNPPSKSYDNSGLTMTGGDPGILTWTHGYGYDGDSYKPYANTWTVDYDLGTVYPLAGAYVWNSGNGRSQDGYNIYVSVDDVTYSSAVASGTLLDNNTTQFISFSTNARYVRFEGVGGGGERTLGEIKFLEGAVPEPSSIALAGMGLVGLGLLGWRKRRG